MADERKLVLSGFGTGDTHQAMNSFTWSPDGELFFCQGDGIESRVETPWGVSSLYQAGVYRLRPGRLELHGLLDDFMGPGNPWGVVFDDWGQSLVVDGAGGVTYLTPASIPAKKRLRLGRIGNPGGYCGVEMINGRNMPSRCAPVRDQRFQVQHREALFAAAGGIRLQARLEDPVLKSSHRKFRPVDIRMGPDGAIYVADFYNNVICHQDDYFRDPTRDLHHGRIWRVTYKKNPLAPKPTFAKDSTGQLLDKLKAPERWTRQQAKFELSKRHGSLVRDMADRWIRRMDADEPNYSRNLLEALALCATAEAVSPQLLERALASDDHRVRAFAARLASRWQDRLANTHELLELAANDAHPQVRLEAILSCGQVPQAGVIKLAGQAVSRHSRDKWIDYAFTQAVRHQERRWMAGLTEGTLDFAEDTGSMLAVLEKGGSKQMLSRLITWPSRKKSAPTGCPGFTGHRLARWPAELRQIFEPGFIFRRPVRRRRGRHSRIQPRRKTGGRPAGHFERRARGHERTAAGAGAGLISRWKVAELQDATATLAFTDGTAQATRLAAVRTWAHWARTKPSAWPS